jgi:hypothetical protein
MVVAPLLVTNRYSLDDFRTELNNINFLEQCHWPRIGKWSRRPAGSLQFSGVRKIAGATKTIDATGTFEKRADVSTHL